MFRKTILSTALVLAAIAANPAQAEDGPVSRSVYFGDLNLASPTGLATFHRRVDRAIELVCGDAYTTDVKTQQALRECQQAARASTGPKIAQIVDRSRRMAAADASTLTIGR